jgi:serine/threonine kinase 16
MPYRAPELFEVQAESTITASTDIWSLGCLLFAMCFKETPFEMVAGQTGSLALAIAQVRATWIHTSIALDVENTLQQRMTLKELHFNTKCLAN